MITLGLLALLACGGSGTTDTGSTVSNTGTDTGTTDNTLTGEPQDSGEPTDTDDRRTDDRHKEDLGTFRDMLAGTVTPEEGLAIVASNGGWPIATDEGHIFVRLDDPKAPYQLSGDHNGWTLSDLEPAPGFWWAQVSIAEPTDSLYKYVDAGGEFGADPQARRYGYDEFGEYSLIEAAAAHLERWPDVTDGVVDARTVRVWVPDATPTHHLYAHDGQNLFDPEGIGGGWNLQSALGSTTLVIAMDNTWSRIEEYTHVTDTLDGELYGGEGDEYADYVQNHIRPWIETEYAIPEKVGTLGSSLGGLISLHIALRHRAKWDFVGSMSGTLGWGSIEQANETILDRYQTGGHIPTAIYIDSGGGPGAGCADTDNDGTRDDTHDSSDNYCENIQMVEILEAVGFVWDEDLWHWWEPDASHNEAAWADRVWRPVSYFEAL
jgi:hypothetical protein